MGGKHGKYQPLLFHRKYLRFEWTGQECIQTTVQPCRAAPCPALPTLPLNSRRLTCPTSVSRTPSSKPRCYIMYYLLMYPFLPLTLKRLKDRDHTLSSVFSAPRQDGGGRHWLNVCGTEPDTRKRNRKNLCPGSNCQKCLWQPLS